MSSLTNHGHRGPYKDCRVNLDLDCAAPDNVPRILRTAAQAYYESASELDSAWQDKGAGKPWQIIARELERAAARIAGRLP